MNKMEEGVVAEARTELTEQSQKSSLGRIVDRDQFANRIPTTTQNKEENACAYVKSEWTEGNATQTSHLEVHHNLLLKVTGAGLNVRDCFEIYHTKVNYLE